jgi:DNA invertase Pin-like site-specific DNA recombinase
VGYARVSTDDQTTRLQLDALKVAGCDPVFEESESGARRSRPQLDRALGELRPGDTLVVWKLDRLGRSLRDLLDVAEALRERYIALRSLTEHIDTSTAAGKMLYAVLGAVAQFERDVLRERTVAGMRAAKSRGEHIGRPPALSPCRFGRPRRCWIAARAPITSRASCASAGRRCTVQFMKSERRPDEPWNLPPVPPGVTNTEFSTRRADNSSAYRWRLGHEFDSCRE